MKQIIFLVGFIFPVYFFAEQNVLHFTNNSKKRIIIRYKAQLSDKREKYVITLPIESGITTKTDLALVSTKISVMSLREKKLFEILIDTNKKLIIADNPKSGQLLFIQKDKE